jgi:hypothetical protein
MVVDEKSHFDAKEAESEKYHSQKLFSSIKNPAVLVTATEEDNAYKGVHLQRTVYMLQLPDGKKIMADIFNVTSNEEHQYDLPFHYNGHLISTSVKYESFKSKQETLGKKNGYQFLWNEAQADVRDTLVQLTFLNSRTYYTISSLVLDKAQLFFIRTGANDPNFNLRHEPAMIIRKKGKNQSFVNVIEIHGSFDPVFEFSYNSYSQVKQISLLENNDTFSVAEILIGGKKLLIAQCNKDFTTTTSHSIDTDKVKMDWTGPYTIIYDGKLLQ